MGQILGCDSETTIWRNGETGGPNDVLEIGCNAPTAETRPPKAAIPWALRRRYGVE